MNYENKKEKLVNLLFSKYFTKIDDNNAKSIDTKKIIIDKSIAYIDNLINLYKRARHIELFDENTAMYNDLIKWLYNYMCLTEDYAEFVQIFGLDISCSTVAELDKGKLDSIVKHPARVISPYAVTMGEESSSLYDFKDMTVIGSNNHIYLPQDLDILTFVTQNPYNELFIHNFERMSNEEGYNLGIGIYGYKDEEDMKEKMSMIEKFNKLLHNSTLNYETDGEKYFGIVTTGLKKKKLSKKLYFSNYKTK